MFCACTLHTHVRSILNWIIPLKLLPHPVYGYDHKTEMECSILCSIINRYILWGLHLSMCTNNSFSPNMHQDKCESHSSTCAMTRALQVCTIPILAQPYVCEQMYCQFGTYTKYKAMSFSWHFYILVKINALAVVDEIIYILMYSLLF